MVVVGVLLICLRSRIWRFLLWGWEIQWGRLADTFIRRQHQHSLILVGIFAILLGVLNIVVGITRLLDHQ